MFPSKVANMAQLAFIRAHTLLYRCTGGAIGGRLFGNSVLLLTTIGRKTRKPRTRPLIYHKDGSDWIVVASNAGAPNHPDWWLNLQSHPEATIQVMAEKMRVVGRKATPEETERLWPQFIRAHPNYTEYQRKTTREIPVVILRSKGDTAKRTSDAPVSQGDQDPQNQKHFLASRWKQR